MVHEALQDLAPACSLFLPCLLPSLLSLHLPTHLSTHPFSFGYLQCAELTPTSGHVPLLSPLPETVPPPNYHILPFPLYISLCSNVISSKRDSKMAPTYPLYPFTHIIFLDGSHHHLNFYSLFVECLPLWHETSMGLSRGYVLCPAA